MKILKMLLATLLTLTPSMGMAQNGYYTDRAVGTSQFNGFTGLVPIGYGQVRVCTSADINTSTTPCPHTASIFDLAGSPLSVVGGNFGQVTTDVVGRFNFQAVPGAYWVQVAASGSNTPSLQYAITVSPTTLNPSGLIISGNNFWTGLNSFKSINNVKYADQYAGDICAAINLAIADLPSTGGMVKAFEQGNQPCATDPFNGVTKQVDLEFGAGVTVQPVVTWNVPSNVHLHGAGDMTSVIAFQPAGGATEANKADQIKINSSNVEVDHLKITGTANTARLVSITGGTNVRVHHNTISGAGYLPVAGPLSGIYVNSSNDVWVENNFLTSNGPASASANSNGDITVWVTTPSNRIHIRANQIGGSITNTASIMTFDCQDCDVLNNTIDQNNVINNPPGNTGGYGILSYQNTTRPRNMRILGNHVTNSAGAGIYIAANDSALIANNELLNNGLQETDASLPVGGIALNDCGDCVVSANIVRGSGKDGIVLAAPLVGTSVSNNVIKSSAQHGINVRGVVVDIAISDNTIDTALGNGIFVPTSILRAKITGNWIRTITGNGMNITAPISLLVSSNHVTGYGVGQTGINVATSCTYCEINNNFVDNNGINGVCIGLTGAVSYTINDNIVGDTGAVGSGITLSGASADGLIENNIINNVQNGLNTSAGARAHISGNKFTNNVTNFILSASDTFGPNPVAAAPTNAFTFATLPASQNGQVLYCSDCTIANPTAGGGTGAIVKRLNGAWVGN